MSTIEKYISYATYYYVLFELSHIWRTINVIKYAQSSLTLFADAEHALRTLKKLISDVFVEYASVI